MAADRPRSIHVLLAVLLLAGAAAGCGPAAVETIGFGTGGSGCTLAHPASSFAAGVPVQMVATFSPDPPAGASVAISISRDGKDLPDLAGTEQLDAGENCIGGEWKALDAGHYRVTLTLSAGTELPPLAGGFDVTPAQ